MASRAARFTQSDLKRAVKGATAAGMEVGRVEIDPNGRIVILPNTVVPAKGASSWDEVLT